MADQVETSIERSPARGAIWRALRPHQWVKNGLLFAPAVLAHNELDTAGLLSAARAAALAAVCFSFVASAGYLVNDWLDREADRQHPEKRRRPLASGDLSEPAAVAWFVVLVGGAFAASAFLLPVAFTGLLGVYLLLTIAYSVELKRRAIVDVLVLAAFYTLRVLAGGQAAEVPVTPWLLIFSMFFFLSLGLVKRYAELVAAAARDRTTLAGRGYHVEDLGLVPVMGLSSGFMSLLVIGLWANSAEVIALYRQPTLLWLACPVLFYWVARIWLLAHRGLLDSDPVLFAARDRVSYAAGIILVMIGAVASRGLGG